MFQEQWPTFHIGTLPDSSRSSDTICTLPSCRTTSTRGPIHTYTARLKAQGSLSEEEFLALDAAAQAEVDAAVAFAEAGTWEQVEDLLRDVHTLEGAP